ncbi:hypothetical protein LJC39_03615, partial [Parabacteroides sp. OttesenSCG-928-B22]|nr:hypothetical protein [Parabacteroides sp. OttesenSCG-928-B22]
LSANLPLFSHLNPSSLCQPLLFALRIAFPPPCPAGTPSQAGGKTSISSKQLSLSQEKRFCGAMLPL